MVAAMTKRQEKSRTNYNAVLDTSIVLFNKKGYKDTTIKDICEATGLSNGSVYHLFRNKDDILRHIYERDINISIGLTQDLERKVQDPYHYLLNFMLDIQRLWEKTGPMLLSNKSHWATSRTTLGCSPIQREELHTFITLAQERGTIANTSDPATLVEFLFTMQRGILYGWIIRDDFDMDMYAKTFWPPVIRTLISGEISF